MSCPASNRPPLPGKTLLHYAIPYWRRLSLVLALSLVSTALSLALPYLSKDLVNRALLGRDWHALLAIMAQFLAITLAGFVLNMVSGLRYTRVSAEILFDMRLALYRHLQQLSPRFYAQTRMGEIMSRINNDIGEIQRIAAETALAWVGMLFLAGSIAMLLWLDARLFLLSVALVPASVWALSHYRSRLEGKVATLGQASATIGNFLIETLQGVKLVVTCNAQEREASRFREKKDDFIRALMSMQLLSYLAGGLPGLILSSSTLLEFLYGGYQVIHGALSMGAFVAFLAYQMQLFPPIQALMGLYTSIATARVSLARVDLRYARPDASVRDLQEAAQAAGIAEFIAGLPQQYETQVGERGMALSAGERQRLALARAFLAGPESLDPVSERHVIAGFEAVMRGRTTILITHRLELASQADRVLVLDGAAIAESGTPEELQERQGSFARLFARTAAR